MSEEYQKQHTRPVLMEVDEESRKGRGKHGDEQEGMRRAKSSVFCEGKRE